MKKTTYLVLAVTVAVMLMGAGYAFWTDSVTIDNEVDTGKLEVVWDTQSWHHGPDYPADFDGDNVNSEGSPYLWANFKYKDDSKCAEFDLHNLYPGAWAKYKGKIENVGTIPATFKCADVKIHRNSDQQLMDNLRIVVGYKKFNGDGSRARGPHNGGHIEVTGLDNLEDELNDLFDEVQLDEHQYLELDIPETSYDSVKAFIPGYDPTKGCVIFSLPKCVSGNTAEGQDIQFDLTLNWTQYNDDGSCDPK